ncbi:type II secretion system protein GspG [Haloferula sp. BvORR071]|uniref:type II secretion system protein GspG n=1 Tax=Haloferula sp. BvORR071 TaxID=1396141 RepID=UPI00054FD572|nr:type II secretion system protein GspG [Haloferula sp. BvORR071]
MKRPFNKYSMPLTILSAGVIGLLVAASLVRSVWEGRKIRRFHEDRIELLEAAEKYRAATGSYPTTEQGFEAMIRRRIIQKVQIDAWGNDYRYRLVKREGKEESDVFSSSLRW